MCPISDSDRRSNRSVWTGFFDRVWRVSGVMNCAPDAVRTTWTFAPSLRRSRTISHALYAAIPPVTPRRTSLPARSVIVSQPPREEWVAPLLLPHRRGGPVPREQDGPVRQGEDLLPNGPDQFVVGPPRQVGPADGSREDQVPDEGHLAGQERDVPGGVARRVEDPEPLVPQFHHVPFPDQHVGLRGVLDAQAEHPSLPSRRPHPLHLVRVDVNSRPRPFPEGPDRADVVEVPV